MLRFSGKQRQYFGGQTMKIKFILTILFLLSLCKVRAQEWNRNYFANANIFEVPDSIVFLVIEKMTDSIKAVLPELKNLKSLKIVNEGSTKNNYSALPIKIPQSVYELKSLEKLYLLGSFEPISEKIKNLSHLKNLEINNFNKGNPLPKTIKDLKNLKILRIYGIDTIIPEISELENLVHLSLYGNYYNLPQDIGQLKNLKCLCLMSPNLKELPRSIKS